MVFEIHLCRGFEVTFPIEVNNSISASSTMVCGASQGSISNPTLFLIYINDFSSSTIFNFLFLVSMIPAPPTNK